MNDPDRDIEQILADKGKAARHGFVRRHIGDVLLGVGRGGVDGNALSGNSESVTARRQLSSPLRKVSRAPCHCVTRPVVGGHLSLRIE